MIKTGTKNTKSQDSVTQEKEVVSKVKKGKQKKHSQGIQLGYVKFKADCAKRQINNILKGKISNKLHINQWLLGRGAYHNLNFKGLLQLCEVSNIETFKIYGNNHSAILKQISVTRFPKLKLLNLYGNNILSLEPIIYLFAPNLEQLYLGNNKIHQLLPLRKSYFPVLKILGYQQNRIKDHCQCLTQLNSPILTNLESQMQQGRDKTQGQYNFSWVAKIQSSNCNLLKFDGVDRIKRHENYLRVHKRFDFLQWD